MKQLPADPIDMYAIAARKNIVYAMYAGSMGHGPRTQLSWRA